MREKKCGSSENMRLHFVLLQRDLFLGPKSGASQYWIGRGDEEKTDADEQSEKDTRKAQCGNNVQVRDVNILARSCLAKVISVFRK